MRHARIVFTAAALAAALATPSLADRESAAYFAGRAEKALVAKDFAAAEEGYRRALTEDAGFHPARYGLAQALLGLGKVGPGLAELRQFAADVRADASAPADWKALLAKAEKQFAAMDAAAAEIRKVSDRYADELIALAKKWSEKDPDVAERAARRALVLRPGDTQATAILVSVDDAAKGPPVPLFDGVTLAGWEGGEFPFWQVTNDVILGDVRKGSRELRTQQTFDGDFDVRMEARIVEEKVGEDSMIALLACYQGESDYIGIGLINRKVYFVDRLASQNKRILVKTPVADWKAPFDPGEWNVYEMRFRAEKIVALINGTVVGEDARTERRRSGFVALNAQAAKVTYRKIEVQRR